jgi:hypothetical protein
LTFNVAPDNSKSNFANPRVAGPCIKAPVALKVDPCVGHKNEVELLLYSTVAPAWGQTDENATKLDAVFPVAVRMTMKPLLATKSLIDFNSISKLIVDPVDEFEFAGAAGAPMSSFEQALAKQAKHATDIPLVNVDKNSVRFMIRIFKL